MNKKLSLAIDSPAESQGRSGADFYNDADDMIGDENEGNLIDEANFQIEPANFFGAAANPAGQHKKQAVHS